MSEKTKHSETPSGPTAEQQAIMYWQDETQRAWLLVAKVRRAGRIAMWSAMVFGACVGWLVAVAMQA